MPGTFSIKPQPDPFARLPALADRLGVKPLPDGGTGRSFYLSTGDGRHYDLFDLINALLDRVDKAGGREMGKRSLAAITINVIDDDDRWTFYAKFTNHETGKVVIRPFQQRKPNASDTMSSHAFELGAQTAIHNVIQNGVDYGNC